MMKEFTPTRLHLLGPASNGLALFYYAQKCDYMFLKCSNNSETCSISSKMSKKSSVSSFYSQFGRKMSKLWLPQNFWHYPHPKFHQIWHHPIIFPPKMLMECQFRQKSGKIIGGLIFPIRPKVQICFFFFK